MAEDVVHLSKFCCYDEDTMWCDEYLTAVLQTRSLDEATCLACLEAAIEYGDAARKRWRAVVRPA